MPRRHKIFSWRAFAISVLWSWAKSILLYTSLLGALLIASVILFSNKYEISLLQNHLRSMFDLGVVWLIGFVSFCVGWAAAIRKNGPEGRTFLMMILGGIIAGFLPGLTAGFILTGSETFDALSFIFGWSVITGITTLFISWAWFSLGFYDEWWY